MLKSIIKIILCLCLTQSYTQDKGILWTVAWSPNGNFIAVGGDQGDLKIFSGKTFKLLKTFPVKDVILSRLKWHPFQNKLAVITQSSTFKAKILDLDSEEWTNLKGLKNSFRGLDWNYNGTLLAVSEFEDFVSVFDVNGKLVSRFRADKKGVAGLDWHPKKNVLVTVGSEIGVFNHLGDTLNMFKPRSEEVILLCLEWHKSGNYFAVGDYGDLEKAENKRVQFWNAKGKKLKEIVGGVVEYRNLRWNKNGKKLATASDALRIWNKKGTLCVESKSTDDYLWGIDWSPDGNYIVTSNSKGKIVIWTKTAEKVLELQY
ncbi:WD40 repeat domain-containing protein [Algibacter sp. 2305UL17-15]|uniref:WD40 repeat domain-containing protein n=1 Tax=Algibacter sp. 2305UL17-15 TaxID=3231268 RepID=UPI0034583085